MAKNIKAIKCPSCGSTKSQLLKLDYYRCLSCNTEYFIDSDDININHHYPNSTNINDKVKKIALIIAGAFVLLLLLIPISNLFKSKPKPYEAYSPPVEKKEEPKPITYKWQSSKLAVFQNEKNEPNVFILGSILESDEHNFGNKNFYMGIYDAKTLKKIAIKPIELKKLESEHDRYEVSLQNFDDQHVYFIINEKWIYRLNRTTLAIEDMGKQYQTSHEDLNLGIAKAEFQHRNEAAAFKIITNAGKTLIYFPLINKTYTDKQWWNALSIPLPKTQVKTAYVFTDKSNDFPEEKINLIRYSYNYQAGYPTNDKPRFEWQKDYGRSGIFTGGEPYVKRLLNLYNKEKMRIRDFKIMNPERTFFSPKVLAYNDTEILIAFKATPAEDEKYQIQVLNATDGSILRTFDDQLKYTNNHNSIVSDGYLIENYGFNYYDKNGKLIQSIKEEKLLIDKF